MKRGSSHDGFAHERSIQVKLKPALRELKERYTNDLRWEEDSLRELRYRARLDVVTDLLALLETEAEPSGGHDG